MFDDDVGDASSDEESTDSLKRRRRADGEPSSSSSESEDGPSSDDDAPAYGRRKSKRDDDEMPSDETDFDSHDIPSEYELVDDDLKGSGSEADELPDIDPTNIIKSSRSRRATRSEVTKRRGDEVERVNYTLESSSDDDSSSSDE